MSLKGKTALVTGGARGIDSAAHIGALLNGGVTWWVAGTSIDRIYPACHRGLFREVVAKGGAMFSEIEPRGPTAKYRFRLRNTNLKKSNLIKLNISKTYMYQKTN